MRLFQQMTEVEEHHHLSTIDWWDVCRIVRPDIEWDEFEKLWQEFEDYKRARKNH